MPKNLSALFSPSSIAIIGASKSPKKVGSIIFKNIIKSGFKGGVFPVNPTAKTINKMKCYKDILSIETVPDLAIICIPSPFVPEVLSQCGEKGVKNVVVISAGFKETGIEGQKMEKELEDISKKYEINLLGPNCLGFVNNSVPVNATFGEVDSLEGNLNLISQSGAIATSLFDWLGSINLGFSHFITLGNKAVINESDVLEYLFEKYHGSITSLSEEDTQNHPIGLYLESISNGPAFLEVCKKITKLDPIFILKPGKTSAAANAMQSHTGAIAGADDVMQVAFQEAGIIRCDTLEDFFDLSKAFSWGKVPVGPRVAVVSNAGGPAVISADSIIENGLEMAELSDEVKTTLSDILPKSASILNPVDVLGDALSDRFLNTIETLLKEDSCDSLLVLLTPQMMTEIEETAEVLGDVAKRYDKPIFCSFIGGTKVGKGEKTLNKFHIPFFDYPERAIYAIGKMWGYKKSQDKSNEEDVDIYQVMNFDILPDEVDKVIKDAMGNKQSSLNNNDADMVVSRSGIKTPPTLDAESLEDALNFAEIHGYPVVLKISSAGLLHKKKLGGVILSIKDKDSLQNSWISLEDKVSKMSPDVKNSISFQIQKEVPQGVEVIVGVKRDKTFGLVMLFGAGGSLAELISDKNLCLFPLDLNKVRKLVEGSKIFKILQTSDAGNQNNLNKFYELMVRLGKIMETKQEIEEMEINPVIINKDDVWAVDTKVLLGENKQMPQGPKFKTARALKVEKLTEKMRFFEFETEDRLSVIPGQYISVKVSDTRVNCYSIAGFQNPDKFNLLVDTAPGGPGSQFFDGLKVGDTMSFLGPFGSFTLKPEEEVDNMLFFATGCGTAPLKYMIESALLEGKEDRKVKLYLGVNDFCDIFFKDYFGDLAKKYKNFSYEMAVNNPDPNWDGPVGFITDLVRKDFPDASKCSAYLCGNKFMIEDVSKLLEDNGCPSERIYTEKYGK